MYSQRPVRAGRDSSRVMLTPCVASGVSSACIAPGTLRVDITSEVLSLPDGPASCAAITTKARGVLRLVLDVAGDDLQPVDGGRGFARDRRRCRIPGRHARGLGVADHRHAFGRRKCRVSHS